jgi:hypothetical protein
VWHELRQLGSAVRQPGHAEEAQAVCDEMARRARHNVELIVERLKSEGFRFHSNDDKQTPATAHVPPTDDAPQHLEWLEERFDGVPMTLSSWIRIVGDVWLVGTHPQWPTSAAADPLVIEAEGSRYPGSSLREYFEDELEQWEEDDPDTAGLFVLPLAPDRLHKDNTSGGSPYGIVLPDACADGLFQREAGTMPFVSYLNWAFSEGGFPWSTGTDAWRIKSRLAADLLPL